MYAYAKVIIERPEVQALPESALTYVGDQAYCWTYENGRAVRTEVRTGVADGEWIEVTNRQVPKATTRARPWVPIDGKEQVIMGDLSLLADGAAGGDRPGGGRDETGERGAHRRIAARRTMPSAIARTRGGVERRDRRGKTEL